MEKMTEQDHIDAAQDHILAFKKHLKAIQKINQDAGRPMAANAAMKAHGKTEVLHAECLEDLASHWSEQTATGVSIRGGGDR